MGPSGLPPPPPSSPASYSCNLHFYSTDNHSSPHSSLIVFYFIPSIFSKFTTFYIRSQQQHFPLCYSSCFFHLQSSLNSHCPSPFPFHCMNSPQLYLEYIIYIYTHTHANTQFDVYTCLKNSLQVCLYIYLYHLPLSVFLSIWIWLCFFITQSFSIPVRPYFFLLFFHFISL